MSRMMYQNVVVDVFMVVGSESEVLDFTRTPAGTRVAQRNGFGEGGTNDIGGRRSGTMRNSIRQIREYR